MLQTIYSSCVDDIILTTSVNVSIFSNSLFNIIVYNQFSHVRLFTHYEYD